MYNIRVKKKMENGENNVVLVLIISPTTTAPEKDDYASPYMCVYLYNSVLLCTLKSPPNS